MAKQEETRMDKELQTRIETYIVLHAETLNIPIGTLEWSEAHAPTPGTDIPPLPQSINSKCQSTENSIS